MVFRSPRLVAGFLSVIGIVVTTSGCVEQHVSGRHTEQQVTASLPNFDSSSLSPEQSAVGAVVANSIDMLFVPIPAGRFLMGTPETAVFRQEGETLHEVELTHSFYLGVFTVTQEQYERVMKENPSQTQSPHYPVENVSWDAAVAFCQTLSALPEEIQSGHTYRLPTEAEWEYACRAGTTTAYSCGDDVQLLRDYAWFHDNANREVHAVGQKLPNPWCLYDMHGNVFQWCQDEFTDYDSRHVKDPISNGASNTQVARGGSWCCLSAQLVRSASRHAFDRNASTNYIGFRVVLETVRDLPETQIDDSDGRDES